MIHQNEATTEVSKETLIDMIRSLHGCEASWVKSVPVGESFESRTVWEGVVQVFSISGHPTASRWYAWSHLVDDTGKRKFFAVLHEGPVDSPQAAVRAAIVAEYRQGKK